MMYPIFVFNVPKYDTYISILRLIINIWRLMLISGIKISLDREYSQLVTPIEYRVTKITYYNVSALLYNRKINTKILLFLQDLYHYNY